MKARRWAVLWVLVLLVSLLHMGAAAHAEQAGAVYQLKWLKAFYDNTSGYEVPHTLTQDSLTVESTSSNTLRNYTVTNRLEVLFSFSGEQQSTVPANTVEIRIPGSIFTNAQGKPAESSVVVPLPDDTSFNYRRDSDTNEIIIYNFREIDEAMVFSVQIDYKVLPSSIALPSRPGETIQPYTKDIQGKVQIVRPGMPVVNATTNTIDLSYKTDSKLNSASKSVSSSGVYAEWPTSWGPAPAGEENDKYFYVVWSLYRYLPATNTQPFTINTTDVMPADGGQVVGWGSFSQPTLANFADGWDNNLEEYNRSAASSYRVASPSVYTSSNTSYLHMRYPRSLLQLNPSTGAMEYRISNTMRDELIGDYGATDFREATGTYLYQEKAWKPSPGASVTKSSKGPSPGMIDRLEQAWLAGSTALLSLHPSPQYTWYMSSSQTDWARTQDENGAYGQVAWTAVHQDNQFSFDTSSPTSTYYQALQKGDFALTALTLNQPAEYIYGEPTAQGTNQLIDQAADKYGQVVVQVTTVDNPAEADWQTIGVSTLKPVQNTGWVFTPNGGAPVNVSNRASHTIDLTQAVPDADVLGVRMLQTTKAASAQQSYSLRMSLYPTKRVIDGLRPPPARTGDIRSLVPLYNLATSQATGGTADKDSVKRSNYTSMHLTRQTYSSSHSKSVSSGTVDRVNKLVRFGYTLHAYNATPFASGTAEADAVAMNLLTEQKTGIFYDLLPTGTTVDLNSIQAFLYRGGSSYSNYRAEHAVQVIDNFKNTGRSMLIVTCTTPETLSNFYGYASSSQYNLVSGYTLRFNVINTFDNLLDNPKFGRNYSAYESLVGPLGYGVSDMPPNSFNEETAKTAFTDVNGKDEPDNRRFMHAYADWRIDPPMSKQLGFDKLVKTPEDAGYSKETVVQGGGLYTYRLRVANEPNTSARGLIFYDSLEDRAPADAPEFWQGTLQNIDLSHPRLTWGLEPVVYYATREVNPKDVLGDRLVLNGQLNTALWSKLDLTQTYPANLKAIAVDMRYLPNGEPFVLPPERSLVVLLTMRAPGDVTPFVNPTDYAWNSSFLGSQLERGGVISDPSVVDVTPTRVSLKPVDLEVTKSSSPSSGTSEAPTVVMEGNSIVYTFGVRNINRAEAIPGVVLEDQIPDGLSILPNSIQYRFGTSSFQALNTTQRITMTQQDQKLVFTIDQLAAGERVEFRVTARAKWPTQDGPIRHVNTARVTRAFGFDQHIESPTTYHETPVVTAQLPFRKLLNAGGRVPKAGEFQVEVTDTTAARNRVAGPFTNSGEAPYNFDIPLKIGRSGYHYFYVREVQPSPPEEGMVYSSVEFYVTVYVTYSNRQLTVGSINIRLGSAVQTDAKIINTYRASGTYKPTIGKRVFINDADGKRYIALSNDQYHATLTDEMGRQQAVYNAVLDTSDPTMHAFTFPERYYTEDDIGKTYKFLFKETLGTRDSIKYDERTIRLELLVKDAGGGVLAFEERYFLDDNDPATQDPAVDGVFENEYLVTTYTIRKLWRVPSEGGYTQDEIPGSITATMQLYQDGAPYGDPVTMTFAHQESADKKHDWVYTWTDLPLYKYDEDEQSQLFAYTAREVAPPAQFQVIQDGNVITNIFQRGTFTARKIWSGLPDPMPVDYLLPKVTLQLHQIYLPGSLDRSSIDPALEADWLAFLENWSEHYANATLDGLPDSANNTGYEVTPWTYQWFGLPLNGTVSRKINETDTLTAKISFAYKVREATLQDPNKDDFFIDTKASASAYVTNVYDRTSFTATKMWENGPADDRPLVTLQLLQDGEVYPDAPVAELSFAAGPSEEPPLALSHTWEDLPKYKDKKTGELHQYSVQEILPDGAPYEKRDSEDPTTVINSYVPPTTEVTATKKWVNGPREDHQAPELRLMRGLKLEGPFEAVDVPATPVSASPETGEYKFKWEGLPTTTIGGRPFWYRVVEVRVDDAGMVAVGYNLYKSVTEYDSTVSGDKVRHFNITNTYQVPKGTVRAAKRWVNGPTGDHTQVEMLLYRSKPNEQPALLDTVPPKVEQITPGVWQYEWNGLDLTDTDGIEYVYHVQEKDVTDGRIEVDGRAYAVTQEGFLIRNTYVQPMTTVTATKLWQGGPAEDHTQVQLLLYRHLGGASAEPQLVLASSGQPDEPLLPAVTQEDENAPFVYTWANVPATDLLGVPYVYSVMEQGEEDGHITVGEAPAEDPSPDPQRVYAVTKTAVTNDTGTAITVTNRFIPPLGDIEATKRWVGGASEDHTAVTLDLYRKTEDMDTPELVAGVDYQVEDGLAAQYFYTWSDLPLTDADAQPYVYSVVEHDAEDGRVIINKRTYSVHVDGLEVVNTFLPPLKTIVCIKNWVGGYEEDHVPVEMEMYRFTEGMPEPFKLESQPEISGEGPFTYQWRDLPFSSMAGERYTYLIVEKDAVDGVLVSNGHFYQSVRHPGIDPTRYTNTFLEPAPFTFVPDARKVFEGGQLKAQQFSFLFTDHEGAERTVHNKADGTLELAPITLSQPGTYVFGLNEVQGREEGITYDKAAYQLTLVLETNANNELAVASGAWTRNGEPYTADQVLFTNVKAAPKPVDPPKPIDPPKPTYPTLEVPLTARKVLKNGTLQAGEFTFVLKDIKGEVLAEVTNGQDGTIAFPNRTFSRAVKDYTYTITERKGTDSKTTYDDTVYTVKITTTASGGQLQAKVDVLKNGTPYAGDLVFTNQRAVPPTGDNTPQRILLLLTLAMALGGGAWVLRRRARRASN